MNDMYNDDLETLKEIFFDLYEEREFAENTRLDFFFKTYFLVCDDNQLLNDNADNITDSDRVILNGLKMNMLLILRLIRQNQELYQYNQYIAETLSSMESTYSNIENICSNIESIYSNIEGTCLNIERKYSNIESTCSDIKRKCSDIERKCSDISALEYKINTMYYRKI